ncbi:MAG: L-seryl-tRNA(Sec) selenium transferase [Chloroflexota bacterium]
MTTSHERLRMLPSVQAMLEHPDVARFIAIHGYEATRDAVRAALESERRDILSGDYDDLTAPTRPDRIRQHLPQPTTLRPVINATGVIIHTNLGRAPLSTEAAHAMQAIAGRYSTLEFDIDTGKRGSRNLHPEKLLTDVTGAQAALVVNNAAAALVLVLAALAVNREVIISRGQLVEIGGGFRIPDIMAQSGAQLVEVGTTNKTRPDDYASAITENTAVLMRIHASNFKQLGFTTSVNIADIARIAREHGVLFVDDVGSGALLDTTQFGLDPEPMVQASIAAGADVVLFSGDKLLGGPQAGIIVGKNETITRLKRHPLARALRADKTTHAGLLATLEHYRRGDALEKVPVWWMMGRSLCDLGRIAKRWSKQFSAADIQKGASTVGGGSLPGSTLPTVLLSLDVPRPDAFLKRLRHASTPIIARIHEGRVLLDPRTVFPEQEDTLLAALDEALKNHS